MSQILWIGCLESDEEFKRKAKKGYDLALHRYLKKIYFMELKKLVILYAIL